LENLQNQFIRSLQQPVAAIKVYLSGRAQSRPYSF